MVDETFLFALQFRRRIPESGFVQKIQEFLLFCVQSEIEISAEDHGVFRRGGSADECGDLTELRDTGLAGDTGRACRQMRGVEIQRSSVELETDHQNPLGSEPVFQ